MQLQQDLDNLKSELELKTKKADINIGYIQSELNKSKQLVEQFQEAAKKAKEIGKEELSEKCDKLMGTIEKDLATKVMQLLQNKLGYCYEEFEKKFKKIVPNYEVCCCSNNVQ